MTPINLVGVRDLARWFVSRAKEDLASTVVTPVISLSRQIGFELDY